MVGAPTDNEDRIGDFIRRSLDGIIIIDSKGTIIDWNDAEEQITGISRLEAIGQPLWEIQYRLTPQEQRVPAFLESAREKIFRGLKESTQLKRFLEDQIERPDGARRTVQSIIFSIESNHETLACGICRDITNQKLKEADLEKRVHAGDRELEEHSRELQRLALDLSHAEDEERRRISDVLHGDLQQQLSAAKLQLQMLSSRLEDNAALREVAERINDMVTDAIQQSRTLSHQLNPPGLSRGDLSQTLEWLTAQMKAQHGLTVYLRKPERLELSSNLLAGLLYRAAQEILFNVVKHAGVKEAWVQIRRCSRWTCLAVSDKGSGFDPLSLDNALGYGLLNIRERLKFLGGRMRIRSAAGKGSRFLVAVPDSGPVTVSPNK